MPFFTMASAISRTTLSVTLPWNLFQLFQPMGGASASPLDLTGGGTGNETFGGVGGSALGRSADTRVNSVRCVRLPGIKSVSFSPAASPP